MVSDLPLVLTHGKCYDGHTSAWVFRRLMGDAEFVECTYGQVPPDTAGREVYVIDFSWPRDTLVKMAAKAESFMVLDHHKTAQADLAGLPFCTFDMDRSGAGLAWDTFSVNPETGMCDNCGAKWWHKKGCLLRRPWLVDYVEDRDLWRMNLPNSEDINAWVHAQSMTMDSWNDLAATPLETVRTLGRAVRLYVNQYGEHACAEARLENVGGHVVPTMNLPYMDCSEHVGRLLGMYPGAAFAAGYFRRADGRWQFSLRSRKDFDVSVVANGFGGGGHAQASGFHVQKLPWE